MNGGAATTYEATFELYDPQGSLVDIKTVGADSYLNKMFVDNRNGKYALSSVVYVDTVAIAATTNVGFVDIIR